MENNTPTTPPTTTPIQEAQNPQPQSAGQGPVIVAPGTPTSNISPVAPPQKQDGKNKKLILVAVILIVLIAILSAVYFFTIKQSNNKTLEKPPVVAAPTIAQPTPTPTPTDDEILRENPEDPTTDITPLEKDLTNL